MTTTKLNERSLKSFQKRFAIGNKTIESLEQYYTEHLILDKSIDAISSILDKLKWESKLSLIDFSCGENIFAAKCMERGIVENYFSVDISPPLNYFGSVIKQDWLQLEQIPVSFSNVILGINPPYGFRGNTALKFLEHSMKLCKPLLICLILPYSVAKRNEKSLFKNELYSLQYSEQLPAKSFYTIDPLTNDNTSFTYQSFICIYVHREYSSLLSPRLCSANEKCAIPSWILSVIPCYITNKKVKEQSNFLILRRIGNNCGRNGFIVVKTNEWFEFRLGKIIGTCDPYVSGSNYTHMALELPDWIAFSECNLTLILQALNDYRVGQNYYKSGFNLKDVASALKSTLLDGPD